MRHHAIIVTGWDQKSILGAYGLASMMGMRPCAPIASKINGCHSFFVPPDGSKEGRVVSEKGDRDRQTFLAKLTCKLDAKEWMGLTFVEVQYADDDGDDKVVRTDATER